MGKDALSLARASHGLQLQLLHNVAAVEAHTHVCADMCVCVCIRMSVSVASVLP